MAVRIMLLLRANSWRLIMDQQIRAINVEEIMTEIRQKIAERGETPDVLGFDEIHVSEPCEDGVKNNARFDKTALHNTIMGASAEHNIPYYQMIPKGGLKSFVKRSVRKVIAFIILPLRDGQNRFNALVVQSLMQLEAYTIRQDQNLDRKEQEERFVKQEEDIEKLTQRLQDLERKYEALLAEKNRG